MSPQPIKVAFYSYKDYDSQSFDQANSDHGSPLEVTYIEARLTLDTALLAEGHHAVCIFVNDDAGAEVLERLSKFGITIVALRCAGTNNVDLNSAKTLGLKICHVPSYSPHAVAEFTVGLILTINRKYHKAYNRTREGDFSLTGLVGANLYQKKVGLIGTGRIGLLTGKILALGMGCEVVAYDPYPNPKVATEHGITYVDTLEKLLTDSDIVSLHCPLSDGTYHLLNDKTFALMKKGVLLVNTSRGGLLDTRALIRALKSGRVGAVGLDVYEGESEYFFNDSRHKVIQDDVLGRLMSFYNVFVSGHQAFLTVEALHNIADQSIEGIVQNSGESTG